MNLHLSQNARQEAVRPEILAAVRSISGVELRQWVETISHPRHRLAQPEQNEATAHWLADQLRGWGYDVELQGEFRNVVARPRGGPSQYVLIGAHYDSVPNTPGADDNASAVAGLLGCAKACAAVNGGAGLMFVVFNGEEEHLSGSYDFVTRFQATRPYGITTVHVLEMIGFANHAPGSQRVPPGLPVRLPDKGDFLGLLANQHTGAALPQTLTAARTYVPGFDVLGLEVLNGMEKMLPVLLRSDHAPFWEERISAMMWTDTSEFRNPYYHQPTDTPETLDYAYLQQVTQVLVATVLSTALSA